MVAPGRPNVNTRRPEPISDTDQHFIVVGVEIEDDQTREPNAVRQGVGLLHFPEDQLDREPATTRELDQRRLALRPLA